MTAKLECPECRAAVGGNDFQCTQCGLLLDPQQASGEYIITEPTIVRALLSPPQRTRTMELPRPPPQHPTPHDLATARFTVPMDAHTVPHLRAGLDIALQPLHPFEAHIASFIDGDHAVPELAQAARLPEIEVKVVLKALLERGVVELHRLPGAPAMRTMTDELPILDGQDFLVPEPMALGDEEPPTRQVPPSPPIIPPRTVRRLGIEPGSAEDFLQRAVRWEREGQVDRAIDVLTRAIARVPEAAVLYSKLALILVHQRKDYRRAVELLKRAVALEPNHPVFQQNLLKVTGLAAASPSPHKEEKRGLFARLTGRRS
ncbi:tetratricopeptide repeat protein [Myxococcus sp. NMCA1]|uniref:tetratricopeptide repeat protein n=1 Tax=Myxococcus sp. NMCA1 TaxID=2996785 RepID=UPI0022855C21|nr:tetratricopeptide repeat protein [Myxococcus sp. NMCA1]WAM24694.1 tetratricopeptide repeat protein [Myxococcus sp. NMCA1]